MCVREREREFLKKISSRQPPVHNDYMDILLMDMDSMQVSNKIKKNTMVTTATTTPHHNQPHTHFIISMKLFTLLWKGVTFSSTHSEQVTMTIMIKQKTILSNFEPNKPDPHPTKKT